jgi:acyl carrier protein
MAMTHAESLNRVRETVAEMQYIDASTLNENTQLDNDLHMGRTDIVEMCVWLSEAFNVTIEPCDVRSKTLGGIATTARIKAWKERQKALSSGQVLQPVC